MTALRSRRPPSPRQIQVSVSDVVYERLGTMAAAANVSRTAYATTLLMAAYSARAKPPTGDLDLDAAVGRVMFLWAEGRDTAAIAAVLGLSEATVQRVVQAWRDEVLTQVSA